MYAMPGLLGLSPDFARYTLHCPVTSAIISRVTSPSRRIWGISPVQSKTVLSIPPEQAPPSKMSPIFPLKSSKTCLAVTGETCLERLALGAATGRFTAFKNACAAGEEGTRIARVSRPQETYLDTFPVDGYTMVKGPGRNALRSAAA